MLWTQLYQPQIIIKEMFFFATSQRIKFEHILYNISTHESAAILLLYSVHLYWEVKFLFEHKIKWITKLKICKENIYKSHRDPFLCLLLEKNVKNFNGSSVHRSRTLLYIRKHLNTKIITEKHYTYQLARFFIHQTLVVYVFIKRHIHLYFKEKKMLIDSYTDSLEFLLLNV